MQSPLRRYILVAVIALAAAMVVILAALALRRDSFQSACNTFMQYVAAGEIDKSYDMFSDAAKKSLTKDSWKAMAEGFVPSHLKAEKQSVTVSDALQNSSSDEPLPRKLVSYILTREENAASVSCYVVKNDAGYQIDAYAVAPAEQETDNQ